MCVKKIPFSVNIDVWDIYIYRCKFNFCLVFGIRQCIKYMILREIKIKFEPKKKLNHNIYIWYLSISKFSILTITQSWISHFVLLLRCNWVINVRCEYTYIRKTTQLAFHGKINRVWRLQIKPQCFSILYRLLLFERYMGSNDTTETLFFFIK